MRKLLNAGRLFGIDAARLQVSIRGIPRFVADYSRFVARCEPGDVKPRLRYLKPILADRSEGAGSMSDYFLQDLWAARKIFNERPKRHLDVGSRLDGFIGSLLTFVDVDVIDVRPLVSQVSGLNFVQADATDLSAWLTGSRESVSSLHAIEHFGLGRYGDPIDPKASFRAMAELRRILAPGGSLYLSVPVGADRIEFNAHRVFSPRTILEQFSELELVNLALIDDGVRFHENATEQLAGSQRFGIGLFHFRKPSLGA